MYHKIIIIIFLFAISTTTSAFTINKTEEDIATQKQLKDLEKCSGEKYNDSALNTELCDTIIDFVANSSIDVCTGPVKLFPGTVICKNVFFNYALALNEICVGTIYGATALWCSDRDNICCLKRAHDAFRVLYPSCEQLKKAVIDFSVKLCKMSKTKALETAYAEQCRSDISLVLSKPRETCCKIFSPNYNISTIDLSNL
uniref:Uncharacterized protein n=2 Tax=Meloidogyne TaxID=189290 RepID=A0A6V7U6D6_MELEN|nr:unnamed protein product [Meloidogyne enterolobii]